MSSRVIIFLLLIFFSSQVSSDGQLGGKYGSSDGYGGGLTFNVLSYGAKPGSKQESTEAFIRAWRAACDSDGEAIVLIPPGIYRLAETIFQGPCKSQIPITVMVQGTLQAVSDPSAYSGEWWILFSQVDGLTVTGGGTIDGQGKELWQYNDCKTNPNCVHMPVSIYMSKVSNAKIKSINLVNSMGFHMHITNTSMMSLHSLTITAPEDSPNTNGIHVSKSNEVKISRSVIKTGDDCISVGQGSTNVTINEIICGPGHGISVGSLGKEPKELDVKGLIVKNSTLQGTKNGIRIKTFPASDSSRASEMLFEDIIMENVHNPIIIDQNYGTKSNQPSLVKISDVIYKNIKGTTLSAVAISLVCSSQVPCENVHFEDIDLQFKGVGKLTSICDNAKVGYSGKQIPPPCSI